MHLLNCVFLLLPLQIGTMDAVGLQPTASMPNAVAEVGSLEAELSYTAKLGIVLRKPAALVFFALAFLWGYATGVVDSAAAAAAVCRAQCFFGGTWVGF